MGAGGALTISRGLIAGFFAFAACCMPTHAHAQAGKEASAAPSDGPRFEIRRFVFEGASLVSAADLDAATRAFSGRERSFADVQRALEAVEKLYSARGYSAVQVVLPEQELEKGEVRFTLIEAKLGRLLVEGNKFYTVKPTCARACLRLRPEKPPTSTMWRATCA